MVGFTIPDDELLNTAITGPPELEHADDDNNMHSPVRPRSPAQAQPNDPATDNAATNDTENAAMSATDPWASVAPQAATSNRIGSSSGQQRQIVQGLISSKKLAENSVQEIHRFHGAPPAERELMSFALNLELRDVMENIKTAIVSNGMHPDLLENIKTYTAAAFFAPNLMFYKAPQNSPRSKALQKTVLDMLVACRVTHLPSKNDKAMTNKILNIISSGLTNLRSELKTCLSKRKLGEPGVDLGSLITKATRNSSIKVTAEHYGRFAFLSREYGSWSKHPNSSAINYWDWVDKALAKVRSETGNDPVMVQRYFKAVVDVDKKNWNYTEQSGEVFKPSEIEEWQEHAHRAARDLAGK